MFLQEDQRTIEVYGVDLQMSCTDSCIKHLNKNKGFIMKTVPKS